MFSTFCSDSGCAHPDRVGDGRCDDDNNVADCQYDGGDCCPDTCLSICPPGAENEKCEFQCGVEPGFNCKTDEASGFDANDL